MNVLIVLAVIMICILFYKRQNLSPYYEGFSQNSRFVMKQGSDIYDDFYTEIYDQLMQPSKRIAFEIDRVIEMTQPNLKYSVFLDIGSGTGHLVDQLQTRGYQVYGVDKSQSMVKFSEEKYPESQFKCGDIREPMLYDKGTFTHILCTGMTIYQFENKIEFFRNCFYWLMPGGYLVVNLVDPGRFDTIIPAGKPPLFNSPQQYAPRRITDTIIDFVDFEYKASYDFQDPKNKTATLKETFTDELTKNVRQNEITLYMDDMQTILQIAAKLGFIAQSQANMESCTGDQYQYLCILERPQ